MDIRQKRYRRWRRLNAKEEAEMKRARDIIFQTVSLTREYPLSGSSFHEINANSQ
jgi:hypothetical protein